MNNDEILILRTSVTTRQDIKRIEKLFASYPCIHKWNFDFENWEKVLRIESHGWSVDNIIDALRTIGIVASKLE